MTNYSCKTQKRKMVTLTYTQNKYYLMCPCKCMIIGRDVGHNGPFVGSNAVNHI